MIQIYLSSIHADEETDEVGDDDPYVLVVAVALTPSIAGVALQTPTASDVVLYQFHGMHTGGRTGFGLSKPFWGIGGVPATLLNPNDAIFIVVMMENDSGDPGIARGLVDAAVTVSLVESLALVRAAKVTTLIHDVDSARRLPTGFPNFDDPIGPPQELQFSHAELQDAESVRPVTKTMVFSGDGGQYTLGFTAWNNAWHTWFEINPAASHSPGPVVTALNPRQNHIDLFILNANGVWTTWWESDAVGWRPWQMIPESGFLPRANVTALTPRDNHIDLFVSDLRTGVWTTWWESDAVGWRPEWRQIPGPAFKPGVNVAALPTRENHIDLFATDEMGIVRSAWWEPDAIGWRPWFPIGNTPSNFQSGATVTAIMPGVNRIALFVCGTNSVGVIQWNPENGWQPEWRQIPASMLLHAGATVTAISPRGEHIDLFVTDENGIVWSTWWEPPHTNWQPWFQVSVLPTTLPPGATVTALRPRENHIDLFVTDTNGTVWSTWWEPDDTNWRPWFPIGTTPSFQQGAIVSALVPRYNHIDLFVPTIDGVWSSYWEQ